MAREQGAGRPMLPNLATLAVSPGNTLVRCPECASPRQKAQQRTLPRLQQVLRAGQERAAATAAVRHYNPVDYATATVIRGDVMGDVMDTDHDGDCLFHCFYQSLQRSPWIEDYALYRQKIKNACDMREAIVRFMRQNPKMFEAKHQLAIRNTVARHQKRDVDSLTYEEAMPAYCDVMARPTVWGGEPEMEAGAILLNVIVNMFVVPKTDGNLDTARLNASFYPTKSVKDNLEERRSYTKFVFIHQNNHFLYVVPKMPKILKEPKTFPNADEGVEDPVKLLRDLRTKNQGGRAAGAGHGNKNAELKAMALERERRAAQARSNGGACARMPVTLTDGQRAEMDEDEKYARLLHAMELQSIEDAQLARQLAGSA